MFTSFSFSANYSDAQEAYNKGNYSDALHLWHILAKNGHIDSQYSLGLMHAEGVGLPQNFKEAFRWFSLASTQGHIDAQNKLGQMYSKGIGETMPNL